MSTCLFVGVVLASGLDVCACGVLAGPSEAMRRLDEVIVKGYRRTETESSTWAGSVEATAIYIGRSQSNIPAMISGPKVDLKPVAPLPPDTGPGPHPLAFLDLIYKGPMSGDCGMLVSELHHGRTPDSAWNISKADAARVRIGKMEILQVAVTCGEG